MKNLIEDILNFEDGRPLVHHADLRINPDTGEPYTEETLLNAHRAAHHVFMEAYIKAWEKVLPRPTPNDLKNLPKLRYWLDPPKPQEPIRFFTKENIAP